MQTLAQAKIHHPSPPTPSPLKRGRGKKVKNNTKLYKVSNNVFYFFLHFTKKKKHKIIKIRQGGFVESVVKEVHERSGSERKKERPPILPTTKFLRVWGVGGRFPPRKNK
jgi:hypothetical protein